MTMTCGTIFLMWLGEQIDEYGIGNGISLLIMAGILAHMPGAGVRAASKMRTSNWAAVAATLASKLYRAGGAVRRGGGRCGVHHARPTTNSHAKRQARSWSPRLRRHPSILAAQVNQAGVMPIIFASSLLMFPRSSSAVSPTWIDRHGRRSLFRWARHFQRGTSFIYNLLYVLLIYFFCYFWTAITFNPKDMAENLKNYGTFIPGYRPGKRTADYLEKVMVRITYVGAGFLALVAIIPTIVSTSFGRQLQIASFYGGTGLLIAVSVAFDLVQKIDSHLVMRNYKGLLEKQRCQNRYTV